MNNVCQYVVFRLVVFARASCVALAFHFMSAAAVADDQPPSALDGLISVRYSSTAGEIMWGAASDNVLVVGYRVFRDNQFLGVMDARSLFEPNLVPNQSYTYKVSAVDRQGNEGDALTVKISGTNGVSLIGAPPSVAMGDLTDDSDAGELPELEGRNVGGVPDDGGLILYSDSQRSTLAEGDSTGISIALSVQRNFEQKRTVTLSLEPATERDMNELTHAFSTTTLAPDQSGSVLTLKLAVGVAPLLLHERYFQIVADDGVSLTSTNLIIDVTPTRRPDVYLLIGQSNMEGYSEAGKKEIFPGGLDERRERILQLNVQPNSRGIFTDDTTFTDEQHNISNPMFVPAEDPLHEPRFMGIDSKGGTFIGLGLTFAKEALRTSTADIYLVPAAWGATGFCANNNGNLAWNSALTEHAFLGGTLLADRALTRLNLTLRETGGILRGILWHQGGADSNNPDCARTYPENLQNLVQRLRREARPDKRGVAARGKKALIPFIVATQSKGDDSRAKFSLFSSSKQRVDSTHRNVADIIPHSNFVNNDDLVPPKYACGQVSCVHFGAAALRAQGRRFFVALKDIWSVAGAYHY